MQLSRRKIQRHKISIAFLLMFIFSGFFAKIHGFSHSNISAKNSSEILLEGESLFEDIFLSHQNHSNDENSKIDCLWNSFANLQGHINYPAEILILFAAISFYLNFRKENRVKLSYLLTSKLSRAPPFYY